MSACRVTLIVLGAILSCGDLVGTVKPDLKSSESPSTRSVEKIRDVEAIDPGLLPSWNGTGSREPLGKQFSNVPGQTGSFGGTFGTSFGGAGNSLGPDSNFPLSTGQGSATFLPGQGATQAVGGSFLSGQGPPPFIPGQGVPPNIGVFPQGGGGVLPGATLPPGAVAPDTVAFSAARASDFTRVGITQVRFDFTLTDVGYGWYPDRSEFVCYYPGIYYFSFAALSPQSRQFKLSLVRNNQEVISAWGDSNGYQMGSNNAILILNQGDRVYLVLQEGNLHEANNIGRGYTTFTGFRIR